MDRVQAAFDKFGSGNEMFAASVTEVGTLAKSLGVALPTEAAIVAHLKAAIADLSGIFVPQAEPTPTATPSV